MKKNLKKVISTFAALTLAAGSLPVFAANFSDVADTASYKQAVDELVALKVIAGYEDGTFKPDDNIKRSEVTKMIVAAMGPAYTQSAESAYGTVTGFSDVAADHWASGYISTGVANKFIKGMGDGTFAPDANVTYAQVVKMLMVTLGYERPCEDKGGYPTGYLTIAAQYGVTDGVVCEANQYVTRAQVAQLIDNAVNTPIMEEQAWTTSSLIGNSTTLVIKDGKGSGYQTLLTKNHKAYKVKGRVTATNKSSAGSVEVGEVNVDVEVADNFNEEYTNIKDSDYEAISVDEVAIGETAAEDYLLTYSEMLIQKDNDNNFTMLAITPYGKNEIVELKTSSVDFNDTSLSDEENIENNMEDIFEVGGDDYFIMKSFTGSSSKTTKHKIANDAKVIVNGVVLDGDLQDNILEYVVLNDTGDLTLIDTPKDGNSSKDGYYDYIVATYYKSAVVESVTATSTKANVYFSSYDTPEYNMQLQLDDEDFSYDITMDGQSMKVEELQEGDVVSVAWNVEESFKDSTFYDILVKRGTTEGKVTSTGTDTDGHTYYTIGGERYYTANCFTDELESGSEYTLYTDIFGYVLESAELATSKNYGIIHRVYTDTNADADKVTVITAAGTAKTYEIKDGMNGSLGQQLQEIADKELQDRIVTYKVNTSKNQLTSVEKCDDVGVETDAEYSAKTNKVGVKVNDTTVVLNAEDYVTSNKTSDVSLSSVSNFVDGDSYDVIYAGKNSSDASYRFVVVTKGSSSMATDNVIAVVESTGIGTYTDGDGEDHGYVEAYVSGSDELTTIYFVDDEVNGLQKGDVFSYKLDSDGLVDNGDNDFALLFQVNDLVDTYGSADNFYAYTADLLKAHGSEYFAPAIKTGEENFYLPGKWDDTDKSDNSYARLAFGPIVGKTTNSVTFAKTYYDGENVVSDEDDDLLFSLADDVNVFVYDFNGKGSGTLSKAVTGAIQKTNVSKSFKDAETGIVDWDGLSVDTNVYSAFARIVDDEITDILYIISKEK